MKKLVLVILVGFELVMGCYFLFNFYQKKTAERLTRQIQKTALVSKENIVFSHDLEFKHYWEFKPNHVSVEKPDWLPNKVIYIYNNDALHDSLNYTVEKPENIFRIIALGDSFTFGHFVNTQENWTEKLEVMLNDTKAGNLDKVEVLNLGAMGFDIPYLVKRYRDIGAKYDPDLVLWLESGSGFNRFVEQMREYLNECENNPAFLELGTLLEKHHFCWNQAQNEVKQKYGQTYLDGILLDSWTNLFSILNQEKLLYFTFSYASQNRRLVQWKDVFPKASFISNIDRLAQGKHLLEDGHPNPAGHQLIAQTIYNYLQETKPEIFKQ